MLVLLSNVIFLAEINEVDDWLCSEKEQWVNDFDLLHAQLAQYPNSQKFEEGLVGKISFRTGFISHYALCVYVEAFDELGLFRPHGPLSS